MPTAVKSCISAALVPFLSILFIPKNIAAQDFLQPSEVKKLSIEELMNVEVTLVSRSPEKLKQSASAVQVITGEDIRNSGVTNIAEALRLASNLQVAQFRSNVWVIGSRGFNTVFANKLLVMIDGRTVYTPLFAGVFWDMQNVLLEDVERIEVVSGPGATLWGANAVNGVINIVTKNAQETQGLYVSALAGSTSIKDKIAARWGGKIGKKISYKIYGQHFDRGATEKADGSDFDDAWNVTQGGFRMDWNGDRADKYTVQGDYYAGTIKTIGGHSDFNGQNLLGRWERSFSENSNMAVQLYFDRYFKGDPPGKTSDEVNTVDLDFQHRFSAGKRQSLLWGAAYRVVRDRFVSSPAVGMLPEKKSLDLFNAFIQDEIAVSRKIKFTVGTKVLHNVYTGIEVQPGARIALTVNEKNTLWSAVTRAVRTPSRVDVDYFSPTVPSRPTEVSVQGGPDFVSEKAYAYELGYRVQPNERSTFSFSTYYTVFRDIYSLETLPGTLTFQTQNGAEGNMWGAELAGTYQVCDDWRIRGGYTYFDKKLVAKAGRNYNPDYLSNDAKHIALLQSMVNLPYNLNFNITGRYIDNIPTTTAIAGAPAYFTFDAALALVLKHIEISVVGQNLAQRRHTELGELNILRGVYAKITGRF